MANEIAASIAAIGIALAPALMKFAEVPRTADIEVDVDAEVQCIAENDAPIHRRYLGTGTSARLHAGDVVQVISKRKEWRHVAYVLDDSAELGWITTQYLGDCDGASDGKEGPSSKPTKPKKTTSGAPGDAPDIDDSPHALFGVPADADPSDDFLINHGIYVLSYNKKRSDPNWVSWKLTADDLGDEDRQNDFRPDDQLPEDFLHVAKSDYAGSGFDQGHMCPSAQRTATVDMNSLTFLLSNMQPQFHGLNAGPWKSLETFERNQVEKNGKEVYVIAGGLFASKPKTIGRGVAIPKANFRVTVILDAGQDLRDVTPSTPIFAVEMPNEPTGVAGHKWTEFKVKVDDVEKDSGYDFLSKLPDGLETRLESVVGSEH